MLKNLWVIVSPKNAAYGYNNVANTLEFIQGTINTEARLAIKEAVFQNDYKIPHWAFYN